MRALLLGVGMQGRAALHDLAAGGLITEVIAADRDIDSLKALVAEKGYRNVRCENVYAESRASIDALTGTGVNVVVCLLPSRFAPTVAASCVEAGVHFVDTSYAPPELAALSDPAEAKDVTLLGEFGLDPGIDLVMLGEALRRLDAVEEISCYGAGIPEPEAADNPLKYKVSWTFEGVLRSYRREGRLMHDGRVAEIADTEQFNAENVHTIDVDGLGTLEAYPNGDALKYVRFLGDASRLRHMGRYSCRWPGHAAFWKKLVDLHFLDEDPVVVDGVRVSPRRFLAALLEDQLQYKAGERDIALLRVDVRGIRDGRKIRILLEMIDRKDLDTGFTAMSRTVGFTAAIGARMILEGVVTRRGLASPVRDVPWAAFARELGRRRIETRISQSSMS